MLTVWESSRDGDYWELEPLDLYSSRPVDRAGSVTGTNFALREIWARFPRREKAKDPGDEFWRKIRETKEMVAKHKNYKPAYRDSCRENRYLWNRARPPSHMKTTKIFTKVLQVRRDVWNRASSVPCQIPCVYIYLAAREKQMEKTTCAGRLHSSWSIFKPADRGTQREFSSNHSNIALLNVF